jgi:hypothetical protein
MQSGYFVQLLVTLIAIVSRIDILLPEILENMRMSRTSCHRILQAIDVDICYLRLAKAIV